MGRSLTPYLPYLVIGVGGFLGANSRYLVANWVTARVGPTFPFGTLAINVTGSFVIGLFLTLVTERTVVPPSLRLFFATGFLGAYTTFSTFTYESLALLQTGDYLAGTTNLVGSLALGIVAVSLGVLLGRVL